MAVGAEGAPTIRADVGEAGSEVASILRRLGARLSFEELGAGHYVVEGVVVVRVAAGEFERLAREGGLPEAVGGPAAGGRVVLVVEGRTGAERGPMARALAELALSGVSVIRTEGPEQTARLIYAFYSRRARERRRSYLSPSKIRRRGRGLAEARISVLTAVPGIGRRTAEELLEHFGTLRRVLTASFSELEKVVGRAKAERLTEVLDTVYPPALEEGGGQSG